MAHIYPLADRIKYDARILRECLKDSVLLGGVRYIHPFGGRKILYIACVGRTNFGITSLFF